MNVTKTESTLTTREDVQSFPVTVPPGFGRDSGQRWELHYVETVREVEFDGFGRWVTIGEPEVRAYGKRLTLRNTTTGTFHLLYWLHTRDDIEKLATASAT